MWRRPMVEIDGAAIRLRLKSFKYLLALTVGRATTDSGWVDKHTIEPGANQIKYIYQLKAEMAAFGIHGGIIENSGTGHYRLTVPAERVRFDLTALLSHYDYDVRTRAAILAGKEFVTG